MARCEKNSGKDCFSNGKYFAVSEEEKITYFSRACDMHYKAGCSEIKRIKAAEAKRKAKIAAEEKRMDTVYVPSWVRYTIHVYLRMNGNKRYVKCVTAV